jgi:hypothetical protein
LPERYLGQSLGKYRIDALIGAGGFAWVYKAYDPELEIPVALKILKPQYAGDVTFEERFRREASTAARLRHPNIVKIFAVGKERDAVFFAMDYLPQGLSDRLEVMACLPESAVLRMGVDVASALGFAHREGVIHRDIKVDNILFDEHGNAIVADFGIARAVTDHQGQTGSNMVVGTPQYFSPEQARGQALDGRADLYSLGVTLFRAATGKLPFSGDDWYEIARQHVEDKPPKPRSINPGLSRDLEGIILRCLEKKADDRYDSGESLAHDLAQVIQDRGESITMRSNPLIEENTARTAAAPSFRRRVRRMRRAGVMAGAVVIALISGTVLYSGRSGEAMSPTPVAEARPAASSPKRSTPAALAPRPSAAKTLEPRRLIVRSPSNAIVSINDARVGSGTWTTDTLPEGRYQVSAVVKSMSGCPTATDSRSTTLNEYGSKEVRLNPRGCGLLMIDAQPSGSSYTLTSFAGDRTLQGTLPLKRPLMLPSGTYRLKVEARFCADYRNDELRISADSPNPTIRIRQICSG